MCIVAHECANILRVESSVMLIKSFDKGKGKSSRSVFSTKAKAGDKLSAMLVLTQSLALAFVLKTNPDDLPRPYQ
jgi:hypothetical protein